MVTMRDPYEVLGVERSADDATIKKAYRRLAAKHHPDRNPDDADAPKRFREVQEAYELLSDSNRRSQYDRFGFGPDPNATNFSSGGFDPFNPFGDDMMRDFFERATGRSRERYSKPARGRDVLYGLEITLGEALAGCIKKLDVDIPSVCGDCSGTRGRSDVCSRCNGTGQYVRNNGVLMIALTCGVCSGTGNVLVDACKGCGGSGSTTTKKSITVNVPRGIRPGMKLRFGEMGESVNGLQSGDLYIVIDIENDDEKYRVFNDDIHTHVRVEFPELIIGAVKAVKMPDGDVIDVNIPACSNFDDTVIVKGKGYPRSINSDSRGRAVIEFDVKMPDVATDRIRELASEMLKEMRSAKN